MMPETTEKTVEQRERRDTSIKSDPHEIEELKQIAEKAAEEARKVLEAFTNPKRKA